MEQEQAAFSRPDLFDIGGVKIGKDEARQLVTEMSGGSLWPFLLRVLDSANGASVERLVTDQSLTSDHVEEVFRVQGEVLLSRQLASLKQQLVEALSSED